MQRCPSVGWRDHETPPPPLPQTRVVVYQPEYLDLSGMRVLGGMNGSLNKPTAETLVTYGIAPVAGQLRIFKV